MQLTAEQFKPIAPYLPRQRGNVRLDNLELLNAIVYTAANGCKWRALPAHFGNWHIIYMRIKRAQPGDDTPKLIWLQQMNATSLGARTSC
jgi:transposase